MTRLLWLIFVVSFASVFEKSQQVHEVVSLYDYTFTMLHRVPNEFDKLEFIATLDEKFDMKHQHQAFVPHWNDLREFKALKLANLCALVWNEKPPFNDFVRGCIIRRYLKGDNNITLLTAGGDRYIDVLGCSCRHVPNNTHNTNWNDNNAFYVTHYTSHQYFKMAKQFVLGHGDRYRLADFVGIQTHYADIPEILYYYDLNIR